MKLLSTTFHLLLLLFLCLSGALWASEPRQLAALDLKQGERSREGPSWNRLNPKKLKLKSESALIVDSHGQTLFAKAADTSRPIASITKLMTAMVILDSDLPMDETVKITKADRDLLKLTGSRLKYGARLSRKEMLQVALIASDNRAAASLARTYPGGREAFVRAMNHKAASLGMHESQFSDPTGLDAGNLASARDLAVMIRHALEHYPLIKSTTTTQKFTVHPYHDRGPLTFGNTNRLLKNKKWEILLSKTGYIDEAGRCLTMVAEIADEPLVIVLLNSFGKLTPFGDSNRLRKWIEASL